MRAVVSPSNFFVSSRTCVLRRLTSAYVSIRQHTSQYVSIRQRRTCALRRLFWREYVSIRQHTSGYVSIREHTSEEDLCAEKVILARVRLAFALEIRKQRRRLGRCVAYYYVTHTHTHTAPPPLPLRSILLRHTHTHTEISHLLLRSASRAHRVLGLQRIGRATASPAA